VRRAISPFGTFTLNPIGSGSHGAIEARRIFDRHLRENVLPLVARSSPVDMEPHELERLFFEIAHDEFDRQMSARPGGVYFAELGSPAVGKMLVVTQSAAVGPVEIIPLPAMTAWRRRSASTGAGARIGKGTTKAAAQAARAGKTASKHALDGSILERAEGEPADILLQGTRTDGSIY